jgi:hypothetical protein
MPQACDIRTPKFSGYACCRLRGAAEPPIAIVRRDAATAAGSADSTAATRITTERPTRIMVS